LQPRDVRLSHAPRIRNEKKKMKNNLFVLS
jgi:hypothetical protein